MTRKRKRTRLETALGDIVSDKVNEAMSDLVDASAPAQSSEEDLLPEEKDRKEEDQPRREDSALRRIISSFPSSDGYYGKLYKVLPSGSEEMKQFFASLEDIEDPEVEVANLSRERGWGSGTFKLRVFRHGDPGIKRSLRFLVDTGSDAGAIAGSIGSSPGTTVQDSTPLRAKLLELNSLVSTIKELIPKQSGNDAGTLSEILSSTLNRGVEIAKGAGPQQSKSGELAEAITLLKELGVLRPPESQKSDFEETLTKLRSLGLLRNSEERKDEDMFSQLVRLKELGLIKIGGQEEDPLSSVNKIRSLIELLTPLINPGSEKVSFGVEMIRTIGPQLPRMVEHITSAVRDVTDMSRMRLASRLGAPIDSNILLKQKVAKAKEEIKALPPEESMKQAEAGLPPNIHPLMKEVIVNVRASNYNYFPKMKELMTVYVGNHVLEALKTDQVSVETFLAMMEPYLAGVLSKEESSDYFSKFVFWIKSGKLPDQETPSITPEFTSSVSQVSAKCDKCGAEYDYESLEHLQEEPLCPCGGNMIKIQEEEVDYSGGESNAQEN